MLEIDKPQTDAVADALRQLRSRMNVGRWVFEQRAKLGLTQQQVARIAGTKQGRVSEIETLEGNATFDTLDRVTEAVGLELTCQLRKQPLAAVTIDAQNALMTAVYTQSGASPIRELVMQGLTNDMKTANA